MWLPEQPWSSGRDFISAGNSAEGIKQLRDEDVISLQMISPTTEPFFTDGVVAKAVDNVTATGVQYFTSAGNFGNKSYEEVFQANSGPALFGNVMAHDFGAGNYYQTVSLVKGTYTIATQWEDRFSFRRWRNKAVQVDLDL